VRKPRTVIAGAAAIITLLASTLLGAPASAGNSPATDAALENVVMQWNATMLEAVRTGTIGPPMVARALAIVNTCMFDSWAPYTVKAVGTQLGGDLRRPPAERTLANKNKAISYGAYMAAKDLYPASTQLFTDLMLSFGYDPADTSTDTTTPQGIGNVSCDTVLDYRHQDGSNQLGDEPGTPVPGTAYADYTGYVAANDPMDIALPLDPATIHNPNKWQPLTFVDATGTTVTQKWMVPHWYLVEPFALISSDQFQGPIPPAKYGTKKFRQQARDLIDVSANLTDEQKMISEYWSDGPKSETPPGHWNLLAQRVEARDGFNVNTQTGVDHSVKLFFALTNAVFDASIVSWDNKRSFDSIRPISAVRYLFMDRTIRSWGGPYEGTVEMDGSEWYPYQPTTFPTPPFASYSSGHSTFSAAAAEILRIATGSDYFGYSTVIPAGSSKIEPGLTPLRDLTFYWSTFKDAAADAGISRRYGGIHFWQDDFDSQEDGTLLAQQAWNKALMYFKGTAP
jgi:hypothetical protein